MELSVTLQIDAIETVPVTPGTRTGRPIIRPAIRVRDNRFSEDDLIDAMDHQISRFRLSHRRVEVRTCPVRRGAPQTFA
jgi:hypothetical protein